MSFSKKSSLSRLLPLSITAIFLLVPPADSSAQVASEQPATSAEAAGTAPSDSGARAHCRCPVCGRDCACVSGKGGGRHHHGHGTQRGWAKGAGEKGWGRAEMQNAHFLVTHHEQLERTVEDIPNGVRTVTTTDDPELLEALREHVYEMSEMLEGGGRIRQWDPLFAEIFEHGESIQIEIEEIADGVTITETSDDEEVVKLIRAHARKVDQFVARGQEACHEATPLPPDYSGR